MEDLPLSRTERVLGGTSGGPEGMAGRSHPLVRGAQSSSSILVNSCQRGNPVLQHIKGVAWEYADIVPDYQVGLSNGVLFLRYAKETHS